MKVAAAILSLCVMAAPDAAQAGTPPAAAVPATRHLSGLTPQDAAALIVLLQDAQQRLSAGARPSFHLRSGSVAYYDEAALPPREVFLAVPFNEVWQIRQEASNSSLVRYRLAYAPDGLGQPYWDIEAMVSRSGKLEAVTLTYLPPAPF